jgi:hypothetical protein
VQLGPRQGQAGADLAPEPVQVDVGEQAPAAVEEALTGDPGPTGGHSALQAQSPQGTDAVGGQVDAGPGDTPAGFSFDHLRSESGLAQRSGQGQAGQASPDDQDPVGIHSASFILAGPRLQVRGLLRVTRVVVPSAGSRRRRRLQSTTRRAVLARAGAMA